VQAAMRTIEILGLSPFIVRPTEETYCGSNRCKALLDTPSFTRDLIDAYLKCGM
jgi:hypothetical protein